MLASWARVAENLLLVRRLLAGLPLDAARAATEGAALRRESPCSPAWAESLRTLAPEMGRVVLSLLLTVVRETRAAGLAALDDADTELIQAHVIAAVAALADARRLAAGPGR